MTKLYEQKVLKYGPMFMKDLGLTEAQVAGIFGNFAVETGYFKHMQELKPVVAGSKGGYGWAQWTGPRRRQYEDFCKRNQLDKASDDANYKFTVYEFRNTEKKALDLLKLTTTPKAAAETVCLKYERPGIPHMDARIKAAEEAFKILSGKPKLVSDVEKDVAVSGGIVATATGLAMAYQDWIYPIVIFAVTGIILYFAIQLSRRNNDEND